MMRRTGAFAFLLAAVAACDSGQQARQAAFITRDQPVATFSGVATALSSGEFAALSARLSEEGGFFPSDNLVSNETAYLQVLGTLEKSGVRGGAYIGVGPDQNFSYIAHIQPAIAFIIDIRRDNLLHHLLFKSLFHSARNRVDYLSLMLGKPAPADIDQWNDATIDEIVLYIDSTASTPETFAAAQERLLDSLRDFSYPLSGADLLHIQAIHATFYEWGLDIRYSSRGRYSHFPTWRNLMLQTDAEGSRRSYLADESLFRYVQDMQRANLIIPVVGDLSGSHALRAIGKQVAALGLEISAFYVSNVEQYLMRGPEFRDFAETVTRLPFNHRSMIIRSYFPRNRNPRTTPADRMSYQLLEPFDSFVREYRSGGYQNYNELVTKNVVPLDGR
jgi:hypothetical protein